MRHAAPYVEPHASRGKPSDLPVQEPTKYELVINLKTATTRGIMVPVSLLLRAGEISE
jgi:putative ABC transport system substrate-binding protein